MVAASGGSYPLPVADAGTASAYEVRCPRCETSFPPETRRCVHCGRRLERGLLRGPAAAVATAESPLVEEALRRQARAPEAEGARRPGPLPTEEGEEGLEGQRSSGLLWIATAALAVLGSALRVCQGG